MPRGLCALRTLTVCVLPTTSCFCALSAMRAEFEEARTEREEARTVVRVALAGGCAFRALRKACGKLRKVIQAAKYRYWEVYDCEREEFTKAGDTKGWYEYLQDGWRL